MPRVHELRLRGPSVHHTRISGPLLQALLHVMVEGSQRALRFRLEGRSQTPGAPPAWLRRGSSFDVLRGADGLSLQMEAPSLREALPERFAQGELFPQLDSTKSALDLFEDGLEDALNGNADSDLFDEGLVQTFLRLADVFEDGLESLEVMNGHAVAVSLERLRVVEELGRKIPKPREVRVAGRLDAIRYSDKMFTLVFDNGEKLRGIAEHVDEKQLSSLWGRHAVVSGWAFFRPSGTLSRIEAETVDAAREADLAIFQSVPKPFSAALDVRSLHAPQNRRTGINAIIGKWPGSETEEELAAALERLS